MPYLIYVKQPKAIHRFEKELSSLGDCGELHENEASQINFSRENSEIVYIF